MQFTIEGNNTGIVLELPYIYYLGYNIQLNGENIEYKESNNGFIMINIPINCNGDVKVTYSGTKLEKITFAISVISAIGFMIYIIYITRHKG